MGADPKIAKNAVKPSVFFAILGCVHVTGSNKMLVKLTHDGQGVTLSGQYFKKVFTKCVCVFDFVRLSVRV